MSQRLNKEDRIRLQHMLEAACDAVGFAAGKTKLHFEHDRQLQYALVHCVQIIGEAASRMSSEGRGLAGDLPWRQIIGMRNILVHVYYDVELDTVWNVVQSRLPDLIQKLQAFLDSSR